MPEGLVAITDNAEPRMHVQFYRQRDGALVCQEPVFDDDASAADSSLIAVGKAVIVGNSAGDSPAQRTLLGARPPAASPAWTSTTTGVRSGECATAWTNEVEGPSSVEKARWPPGWSTPHEAANLARRQRVVPHGDERPHRRSRVRGAHGRRFSCSTPHGSTILIGPGVAAYVGTVAGLVRVRDRQYSATVTGSPSYAR